MVVTPELAAQWLEGKAPNRDIRTTVVLRYASAMNQGLWVLSPDPIVFDEDDQLINGQHRLWASVESGKSFEALVTRGWPRGVQLIMDQGTPRAMFDNINLSGGIGGKMLTSDDTTVFRLMVLGMSNRDMAMPTEMVKEAMSQYLEAIVFAKEAFGGRTSTPAHRIVRAVISRAFYTKSQDRLRRFARCILEGVTDRASEKVAIRLRDQIMTDWRSCIQRPSKMLMFGRTEATLLHFLSGTCPERVQPVTTEQFEIPSSPAMNRWRDNWEHISKASSKISRLMSSSNSKTREEAFRLARIKKAEPKKERAKLIPKKK
jgi:hypothetical protein